MTRYALAKCLDVSERGIGLEVAMPIPVHSILSVRADTIKLGGSATVRHVGRRTNGYILGLNLSQPLRIGDL